MRLFSVAFMTTLHGGLTMLDAQTAGLSLSPGFHPASANPAFVVSPLAFNQVLLQGTQRHVQAQAHMNIDRLYTGVGLGVERTENGWGISPMAAYHTYFLRSNQHLMGGGQVQVHMTHDRYGKSVARASYRLGLLLYSNPGNRYFAGITFHKNEQVYSLRHKSYFTFNRGGGFQAGHALWRLTRHINLNTALFMNCFLRGPFGQLLSSHWQVTGWMRPWSLGAGWMQEDLRWHAISVRAGYHRKLQVSAAVQVPVSERQNPVLEITLKTLLR